MLISILDFEKAAQRRLPKMVYAYLASGADDEVSLRANVSTFGQYSLIPDRCTDVSAVSTNTTVLGQDSTLPILLAPTGLTRIFHYGGESAVARAAKSQGVTYCVSTVSSESIEKVAEGCGGRLSFQLYPFRDPEVTDRLVERASLSGYGSLCVTVDAPVSGNREAMVRSGLTIPPAIGLNALLDLVTHPKWLLGYARVHPICFKNFVRNEAIGRVSLAEQINNDFDRTFDWRKLRRLRDTWKGTLAIKGILSPRDASHAIDLGVDAIIVSNHGGRQLDGGVPPLFALERIVPAVNHRAEIILDGGIRRGSDVLKALALGATACMVARPYLYGLSVDGERGVGKVLQILRSEIERDMTLMGISNLQEICERHVVKY